MGTNIDALARVELSPEMLAEAFWNMDADQQVQFFASLDRAAGHKLCFQMAWVIRAIAEDGNTEAMNAFRTMFYHAQDYHDSAIELRASNAKRAIAAIAKATKE